MCKYSFLLPAYKSAFFEDALGSILAQTYTDFSVIVSDDCSPEDLKSVIDKFNDPRVTYRRNAKNIGAEHLVEHWNLLLSLTDAEYIIMASDDDVYDSAFLEEIDGLVKKYDDINVFQSRVNQIDANGIVFWKEILSDDVVMDRKMYMQMSAKGLMSSGIPQYVFKRRPLVDAGGFVNFPMAWFSDDATVTRMAENGLAISQKHLFSIRHSGISISTAKAEKKEVWQGKLKASAEYADMMASIVSEYNDSSLLELMYIKARKFVIPMLLESSDGVFFDMMAYIRKFHSPLYPAKWRIRRYVGRFYHKLFR